MKRFRYMLLAALVLALVWAVACSDDDPVQTSVPLGTVTFHLDNVVALDPVALDETNLQYTNPMGTAYSVKTLRYVISDVTLHTTTGETFGMDGIEPPECDRMRETPHEPNGKKNLKGSW